MQSNFTRVKHWREEDTYLISLPSYYFKSSIKNWYITNVGQYFHSFLLSQPEQKRVLYIFYTDTGDCHNNISKIFEFIIKNKEKCVDEIIVFSQCFSCNEIGTVNEKFKDFNLILEEKCNKCTYLQK